MARRKKNRGGSLAQQVLNESALRFGPEQDALVSLIGQAQKTARTRRQSVEAGVRGLNAGIASQASLAGQAAAAHQALTDQIASRVRGNEATLSSAADPYRAIIDSEYQGASLRGAETDQRLQNELGQERVSAGRYQASQLGQIGTDLNDNLQAIGDRLASLKQQQGVFAQARLGELVGQSRQRAFELRKITRTQQGQLNNSLALEKAKAGDASALETQKAADARKKARLDNRLNPGGSKGGSKKNGGFGLTKGQENAEVDKVSNAARYADQLLRAGKTRAEVLAILTNGAQGRKKPAQGQKVGDTFKIPDYGEDRALVALDIAKYGYVRPRNIKRLHARGVHVPSKWRPPRGGDRRNTPYHRPGTLG